MCDLTKMIKKTLIDRGLNITDLAEKIGYSRVHTSKVIHGHSKSDVARHAIIRTLEIDTR